ncbi:hypothetical protein NIES4102_02170 [Chondrocystis sp. NIES-4102]|nr:hypothetical protein NIES4102_02170 [Chondrocystis sp. NIES-4102]
MPYIPLYIGFVRTNRTPTISSFIINKDIYASFDVFMYSFLGGLIGGFIGIIVALPLGFIVYLIIPSDGGFIYSDLNKIVGYIITICLGWLLGIIVGGIKTIKH